MQGDPDQRDRNQFASRRRVNHPARMTAPLTAPTLTDGVVTLRAHRADDVPRHGRAVPGPGVDRLDDGAGALHEADAEEYGLPGHAGRLGRRVGVGVRGRGRGAVRRHVSLRDEGAGPGRDRLRVAPGRPRHRGDPAGAAAAAWTGGSRSWTWRRSCGGRSPATGPAGRLAWRLGFTVEGTLRRYLPERGERATRGSAPCSRTTRASRGRPGWTCRSSTGDGFRLREVRESDAPRIHEGTAEPAAEHWLGHKPAPYTLADAQRYVERRSELAATGAVRHLGDRGPGRRPDPRHGAVVQLDAGGRVRGRLLDPPGRARPRPRDQGRSAGGRPRLRDAGGQAGHRLRRRRQHRLAARGRGRRLPSVRRRAVRRPGPRRLGRHGALRRDGLGVGRRSSGPRANATASTANPASDSTAPISSGDR